MLPDAPPPNLPRLFALLVGIDAYPIRLPGVPVAFPALRGGVGDARRMTEYLRREAAFSLHPVVLTDADATKTALVRQFREHLSQAKTSDVALFYFSGHGTQEAAEPNVWESETDGRLECLVCYPETETGAPFLLADKELRFLLHELAQGGAQVLTIFDCCHAGDVTRAGRVQHEFGQAVEKRIEYVFPARPWAEFIFGDQHSAGEIREQGDLRALPEGRHVRLSACQPDESAWEYGGQGVFTKTLLGILAATGGQVSYHDLDRRARLSLRGVYDQSPQAYATGEADPNAALLRTFLGKPGDPRRAAFGEVIFNPQTAWTLNLGALHGLTTASEVSLRVRESPPTWQLAPIDSVGMATAQVSWPDPAPAPDPQQAYPARVRGLLAHPLRLWVAAPDGPSAVLQALFDDLQTQGYLTPASDEASADYVLRLDEKQGWITLPGDSYRPLLAPVSLGRPSAPALLKADLRQISQWEFLKNLRPHDPVEPTAAPLELTLETLNAGGEPAPLSWQNGEATLPFQADGSGWKSTLRLRILNRSAGSRFVAVVFLRAGFGAFTGLLNPDVYPLGPGETVPLRVKASDTIGLTLPPVVTTYNWPRLSEHLLLLSSPEPFEVAALALAPLPPPPRPGGPARSENAAFRLVGYLPGPPTAEGWSSQLFTLHYPNPQPGPPDGAVLAQGLAGEQTAFFFGGLFAGGN